MLGKEPSGRGSNLFIWVHIFKDVPQFDAFEDIVV